ncbi:hypothetical protein Scep_025453 [Stephania cephalantha]|uniref:Uncharacterized protein n=1 Tax=Stephania cephalantha TaxID=152367 RepID=A0AAP0ES70_9MAGN
MSSKGGSLSGDLSRRDREMKEFGIRLSGGFEDDQEGVRTMDDDNFIDDTGVDPHDQARQLTTKALSGMRHAEKGHETRESLDILLGKVSLLQSAAEVLSGRGRCETASPAPPPPLRLPFLPRLDGAKQFLGNALLSDFLGAAPPPPLLRLLVLHLANARMRLRTLPTPSTPSTPPFAILDCASGFAFHCLGGLRAMDGPINGGIVL